MGASKSRRAFGRPVAKVEEAGEPSRTRTRRRKTGRAISRSRICAFAAVGVALTTVAAAPAAQAAGPSTNSLTIAYAGPSQYTSMVGGIFPNVPVTLYCWVDSTWSLGTNRWFYAAGVGYNPYSGRPAWVVGYVSASKIANQVSVRHC
jgi:hypothetical protein